MPTKLRYFGICALALAAVTLSGCAPKQTEVLVKPLTEYTPKDEVALIEKLRKNKDPNKELHEVYRDLTVIDIHNHDAPNPVAIENWRKVGIDRIVLFGSISEPSAKYTDQLAWEEYQKSPGNVYPSFAGFPIYEEEGVEIVRNNLEKGYLNIGEVAAASTFSESVSRLPWKAEHPNDGNFPKIYDLAAKYQVPILLHIDPPNGKPVAKLEEALDAHPEAILIFGHANAHNTPENIEPLLSKHPNLYIDFFAGFTAYSPSSINKLEDYVPLMEKYPDRFMLSTDSGFGLSRDQAANGIYEMIDLLSPETALKVAYQNYEGLIERQPPTETQIETIKKLSAEAGKFKTYELNKRMANELIFELEGGSS
ncbi:amidohydrolase family protein [Fontibacillus sp. BL9]|uniref:amidohydrolase family protein n=1 Tax=Fontibacillus sp. BL9 TaxID=3389971 RepID=UPI00397C85C2